jgi:prevent-host-death family protein
MEAFAVRDLREHTGDLVRNAERGDYSVVSKHGKPLFVALPFNDALLASGVSVALADKLVLQAELSMASGAKLAGMPYARYLQHLGTLGYSMLDDAADMTAELATLQQHLAAEPVGKLSTKKATKSASKPTVQPSGKLFGKPTKTPSKKA